MNENQRHIIDRMNELGASGTPFVFIIDYEFEKPLLFDFNNSIDLLWQTPELSNYHPGIVPPVNLQWSVYPIELLPNTLCWGYFNCMERFQF